MRVMFEHAPNIQARLVELEILDKQVGIVSGDAPERRWPRPGPPLYAASAWRTSPSNSASCAAR